MTQLETGPQYKKGTGNINTICFLDMDDAQNFIDDLIERGERPVVSVPKQYEPAVRQNGLRAHSTWIIGKRAIVGTIGRGPYLPQFPKEEKRILVRIKDINSEQIRPRPTGADKAFHGVVELKGPIPPESLEILGEF